MLEALKGKVQGGKREGGRGEGGKGGISEMEEMEMPPTEISGRRISIRGNTHVPLEALIAFFEASSHLDRIRQPTACIALEAG